MSFRDGVIEGNPEVYEGGTNEGGDALNFFQKWGWYATFEMLANGKPWKMKWVTEMNVHAAHKFLALTLDKQKLKAKLMKPSKGNTTEL